MTFMKDNVPSGGKKQILDIKPVVVEDIGFFIAARHKFLNLVNRLVLWDNSDIAVPFFLNKGVECGNNEIRNLWFRYVDFIRFDRFYHTSLNLYREYREIFLSSYRRE